MLLYLPFHLLCYFLYKVMGITVAPSKLTPIPYGRAKPTPLHKQANSVTKVIRTPRGFKYTVNTRIMEAVAFGKCRRKRCKTVLLIHGAYTDSSLWQNIMPRLCRMGYNVYAMDLPGFGGSEFQTALLDLTPDELADELGGFMCAYFKHMAISNAVVVGYSFGGFMAMMAAKHAECKRNMDRLLLVAPAGVYPIGSRWSHLYAVVFRLKMLSLFAPELQNQGENLVMRFFETGIYGSRWLKPTLPILLSFGKPCRVIGGSYDGIFSVDHGFLLEEITHKAIRYDGCALSDHYISEKSLLEDHLMDSFKRLVRCSRSKRHRRKACLRRYFLTALSSKVSGLDTRGMLVGIEGSSFYENFHRYREALIAMSKESQEAALKYIRSTPGACSSSGRACMNVEPGIGSTKRAARSRMSVRGRMIRQHRCKRLKALAKCYLR